MVTLESESLWPKKGAETLKPVIAGPDRTKELERISHRRRFKHMLTDKTSSSLGEGTESGIMIDRKTNPTMQIMADLNALYLMISYVELELERIAPECILAVSNLRSSILNVMLSRSPN
jgi:hypothetical protein